MPLSVALPLFASLVASAGLVSTRQRFVGNYCVTLVFGQKVFVHRWEAAQQAMLMKWLMGKGETDDAKAIVDRSGTKRVLKGLDALS